MTRSSTTGLYTRVSNSFSDPVVGTTISPTDADTYFDDIDGAMNAFIGTSTSSVVIGTGSKTLTIASDIATKAFIAGVEVKAFSLANSANYIFGPVTSYSRSTGDLVIDVRVTGGSGTITDWVIIQAGATGYVTAQLGSNLDANSFNIGFDDNTGITDDSGNEQLIFQKTASAVNQVEITNAATGNKPQIAVDGGDTNIGIKIAPKGTGVVEFGGTQGWGFGTSTVNLGGWGGFDNVLTIDNSTARERSIIEVASNATTVGDTIGALAITNRANTGVGASKLTFLMQWNARNYSGGGSTDFSSDMTFSSYNPSTDAFQQVFTIGSTNGIGCILIDTEGPHGINTDECVDAMIYIGGDATKATGATFGAAEILRLATQTAMPVNMGGRGMVLAPRFIEAASGTHALVTSLMLIAPAITNGAATTTTAANLYIDAAPTGGATNYALWIDAGLARFDGGITSEGGSQLYSGTAVPAGGTTGAGLKFSSTSNLGVFFGSGVPSLSAAKGSLYLCTNGSSSSTRMYVNTDGGTTWTAVTTAS